jgi:hypothetical protein
MPGNLLHKTPLFRLLLLSAALVSNAANENWRGAARAVRDTRFPDSFIDSIAAANDIPRNENLAGWRKRPFTTSEKLVYDGGWGAVRAGFLVLTARPGAAPGTYELAGRVATNDFVSAFYKVRDFVLARVDSVGLYPLFFEQHIREGKYRDKRWTVYDHVKGRVFTYKSRDSALAVTPLSHNYLSLLYHLRSLDFGPGDVFSIDCFVHEESHAIRFKALRRETIETPAGSFRCLKLRPTLVGEGRGFTKRDKMHIWVTDDEYKMPVLVKSKIAIGSLSAQLIYYERD